MAKIDLWNPANDTHPDSKKPSPRWCWKCRKHLDPDEFKLKVGVCKQCEWHDPATCVDGKTRTMG